MINQSNMWKGIITANKERITTSFILLQNLRRNWDYEVISQSVIDSEGEEYPTLNEFYDYQIIDALRRSYLAKDESCNKWYVFDSDKKLGFQADLIVVNKRKRKNCKLNTIC